MMTTRVAAFPVKHPSAALLLVQILGVLLYPLMEDTSAERALFGVIGLLVLGAALYVVKRGPWLTGFAVVLAIPVIVLSIWLAFDFDVHRMIILAALEAVFYFYAAGSLIAYMLEDEFASVDELFAAGATFTLLAWAFAYVYVVCQALLPGSFGALATNPPNRHSVRRVTLRLRSANVSGESPVPCRRRSGSHRAFRSDGHARSTSDAPDNRPPPRVLPRRGV
jgi:hypothetical protein